MSDIYSDESGSISGLLLPSAAAATASAGASAEMLDADTRRKELGQVWQELHSHLDAVPPPPPLAAAALPTQLGPFTWNPIVFGGGVPVGGWAQLTLFANGAVNFTGHFHDSGAPSYNITCTYAVRAGDGTVYTFTTTGRTHGTFESGSRNFDFGINPTQTAVAAGWANLSQAWSWQARAGANADIGSLVDSAVKAVGQAASVIAIIA
ncbi:MAG TPA: hypothetical protein VGI96_32515 [Streptosporangiaceae bacterium]|jgi:hypothetical protein